MTRISKQAERRAKYPFKRKNPSKKTGSLKDNLPLGFKAQTNAIEGELAGNAYIPPIK